MKRKHLLQHLKRLGINHAIADANAMSEEYPAILLRWSGRELYYTGFGSDVFDPPDIEDDLIEQWADKNLD